ncbi:MAG: hypothetical protein RMJ87_03185 [Cytophagales bacterium]|nr:hypothetical protein [Bernardetiaceae bacterium]MDW8204011.1 hypothetical protein [Cytophagales bacterium]
MKKYFAIVLFILINVFLLQAQDIALEEDPPYNRQTSYGINLNSNAGLIGGGVIKHTRSISSKMYHLFYLDVVNVRHPKEQRAQSRLSGESFVPGKQNYLLLVRPHYGRELILFRRAAEQGVQVAASLSAGPSIAVIAPYLIEYRFGTGNIRLEQYDPARHPSFDQVIRTSRFGESLSQSKFGVGGSVRAALAFEFGNFRTNVTGVEAGFMADFLAQKVIIMPLAENKQHYFSIFVNIYYGSRN